ncbi:efflux RND transporter periplasmic adaptor subunit [Roseibium aggregatum]|uniref:Efflux RND transporter periplasmic adaptor subunit n=1 Tax=Roseibium aggregatum TaxID=187304 RepID=A0A926S832_9HYPH|nr:efflux RND transporter periplasmic adaptor subunit [Roseibium aggregatum]MBD1549381.1 efflux RND transporter periplasmic adaptor subunit [Roseibium aggregatum]
MRLKFSYVLAIGLAAGIGIWMYSGTYVIGGRGDSADATPPPAERQEKAGNDLFRVQVSTLTATERQPVLEIRGRTEAEAKVEVRAETAARVVERPAIEGNHVSKGDVLCVLDKGTRESKVLEATAALAQAELDHTAASQLNSKGFTAETRVMAMQAALDAAQARVEEAKMELSRTVIHSPIDGVIQSPMANVGARLNIGDVCATVVETDPMIAIGQVSEADIGLISKGMDAEVRLISGQTMSGTVRYIAPAADPETRTFRIEVELPNKEGVARDGTTALTRLKLPSQKAHKISPAILTLNDDGELGLRGVTDDQVTVFYPVKVLGGGEDGIWVGGLPNTVRIITVGQDYVTDGQKVEPVLKTAEVTQ